MTTTATTDKSVLRFPPADQPFLLGWETRGWPKRENRRAKNAKVTTVTVDKIDRGTVQTRALLSPDPLLSATLEPHRAQAGLEIRASLEEGVGAQALDIVQIGMSSGTSSSHHHRILAQRLARASILKLTRAASTDIARKLIKR